MIEAFLGYGHGVIPSFRDQKVQRLCHDLLGEIIEPRASCFRG